MKRKLAVILVVFASISGLILSRHLSVASAASTITVTSATDDGTGCTLREAIESSNDDSAIGGCTAGTGPGDTIAFNIAGVGPHTIAPTSGLPNITDPVTIDGYTESGAAENTAVSPQPLNGTLMIEIDGSGAGSSVGFEVAASDTTIKGLVINGFAFEGIRLSADNAVITGNYIGTNVAGTAAIANTNGIGTNGDVDGVTIGGTDPGERNLISGNESAGIGGFLTADNWTIQGNYIGVNATGAVALPNSTGGSGAGIVLSDGGTNFQIGGTATGAANVISGNDEMGISLRGSTDGVIEGNFVGTDYSGTLDIGNGNAGISLGDAAADITIGGTTTEARNLVSGNQVEGIYIGESSTNVTVLGNYVGTDTTGTSSIPNEVNGVAIGEGSHHNLVGGVTSAARNVISGNNDSGVIILDDGSDSNTISGNYLGTNAAGTAALSNELAGAAIALGAANNTIGGTTDGMRNVISGNEGYGINLSSGVEGNTIQGNYVGLSANGSAVIPNATATANPSGMVIGGNNNVVGGTTVGARNFVAGTTGYGISVLGYTGFGGASSSNNVVQGNCIGTNASCEVQSGFGNTLAGVILVADALNTLVGGTTAGAANIITGNGAGVNVLGVSTLYPLNGSILGNTIHTNSGGAISSIGMDIMQTTNFIAYTNNGVTLNDTGDADQGGTNTGPNHYINFPVINSITSENGEITINYDLDINNTESGATGYRVEFFANENADASGYGEGQYYVGADTVTGDVTGETVTFTNASLTAGTYSFAGITTMTDNSSDGFGHSSEFSAVLAAAVTEVPATPDTAGGGAGSTTTLADSGTSIYVIFGIVGILLLGGLVILRHSRHLIK